MKLLRRILFWLLGIIVLLVVVLAGSIFVDGFFAQGRLDAVTNTTIAAADGTSIRAWVAKPTTPGPHPAVIMIHEFYGLRPEIVGKAEALAQEGYVVIAHPVSKPARRGSAIEEPHTWPSPVQSQQWTWGVKQGYSDWER